jgi:anthranilate synthase component 1
MSTTAPEPTMPSQTQLRGLLRKYELVPVYETRVDDTETPVSAFLKLRAGDGGPAFLLESADQGRVGRFSFIGFHPRKVLRWSLGDPGDPYALAAAELEHTRPAPLPGLEAPFTGGAVGMFAYDLVRTVEPLGDPPADPLGLPDLALMLTDLVVVFDHLRRTVTVIASIRAADVGAALGAPAGAPAGVEVDSQAVDAAIASAYARAQREIADVWERLSGPVPQADATERERRRGRSLPELESNMTRERFEGNVRKIIDYVYAGDVFQVVPSQRWSAPTPVSAFSIYRGLRTINPSPYMYYLDFGDFQIAGASPEPLLTVSGRTARTRPIAGTRPRGASVEEDARIAEGLLADPKERAEHVMLVDLGRNDLGRVCEYGSVQVEDFMVVENYSHVMHIVSNVAGRLREDVGALTALRSLLPAGTLSGAPKVRAMQIIDELEPAKRGGYGGAIGWIGYGGDLDVCIHIRTVVVKDGVAYVQAGGGTVADAKPENEFEESVAKSRAIRAAIELACRQTGWD